MTILTFTLADLPGLEPGPKASSELLAKLCALKPSPNASYSAAEARQAGLSFEEVVVFFSVVACRNREVERRLRLWATDCAARVLHIYERSETSPVPRQAVETARGFLRGEVGAAARNAVCKAAMDLAQQIRMAAPRRALWPARDAATAAKAAAGASPARDAGTDAAGGQEEQNWQYDRLVARLSDPEPEDWPLPARWCPPAKQGPSQRPVGE